MGYLLLVWLAAAPPIDAPAFTVTFQNGGIAHLADRAGHTMSDTPQVTQGNGLRRLKTDHWATAEPVDGVFGQLDGLPGGTLAQQASVDRDTGELVIAQQGTSPEPGLWGVEWAIEGIPLGYNVIVPGRSGIQLGRTSPGNSHTFEYPYGWEAQFVIVTGGDHGFMVRADDAKGRFKRLTVSRSPSGWRLGFATMNHAPFEALTKCESVPWRLSVWQGDWRVPARRYRQWMNASYRPTPLAQQTPAWIADARGMIIMGLDISLLDKLAERFDPKQTVVYVPSWRAPGYDKDYPNYVDVVPNFREFLDRAHQLGFRVMLHVNYFGCDPKNAAYEQLKQYHCRNAFNDELQWWIPPSDRKHPEREPSIKFAYINPAAKAWRDLFVGAMQKLCTDYPIDALHLDQTLCIYNDKNGLIDGMTMLEGSLALHRELRAALPQVALSGEGLNEVTYRDEAFAQRHAWGVHHSEGTWTRSQIATAHPICSYLFRPYTIVNGYLGNSAPGNGQLYAAWNDAYEHWGVIPTLKPSAGLLAEPVAFGRQFFDELAVWQGQRLELDLDGDWPAEVAFPFRAADGTRVVRTVDGRMLVGEQTALRTVTGVSEFTGPGQIGGWPLYDADRVFGLDPDAWYPWFPEARDPQALHVEVAPHGVTLGQLRQTPAYLVVGTRGHGQTVADLLRDVAGAVGGTRPKTGDPYQAVGGFNAPDGGSFSAQDDRFFCHPPWRAPGSGESWLRYELKLPAETPLFFRSLINLDPGAVQPDRSDGVTFTVVARAGAIERQVALHYTNTEPVALDLDLSEFAGQTVSLELSVGPGPAGDPQFDWARWARPRIERTAPPTAELALVGAPRAQQSLSGTTVTPVRQDGARQWVTAEVPGAAYLLASTPPRVNLPLDLAAATFQAAFLSETGEALEHAEYASARPIADAEVGGVAKSGLHCHPPNHGRTLAEFPITLPATPATFSAFVGLREGSSSDGVIFAVEMNGREIASRKMLPGEWQPITADLSPWAGKPVVLTLVTDSDGPYSYDWAVWGEPLVKAK